MIKIKIIEVTGGPYDEEPYESEGGTIYKQAWLCQVDADGKEGTAKLTVGAKSPEGSPLSKYISEGGVVASAKRGIYKGVAQYYVDQKATKALHGDTFQANQHSDNKPKGADERKRFADTGEFTPPKDNRNRSFTGRYATDILIEYEKLLPNAMHTPMGWMSDWVTIADCIFTWLEQESPAPTAVENIVYDPVIQSDFDDNKPNLPADDLPANEEVSIDLLVTALKKVGIYDKVRLFGYTKSTLIDEFQAVNCNMAKFLKVVSDNVKNLPC